MVKVKFLILVSCFAMIIVSLSCGNTSNQNLSNSNAATNKPLEPKNGTLSIEAALVFQSGDVKPVARTEFLLLNKNPEDILKDSEFYQNLPTELKASFITKGLLIGKNQTFVQVITAILKPDKATDNEKQREFQASLRKAFQVGLSSLSPHTVYSTKTDFQGKGQIQDVKPGEYYLFGYTIAGNSGTTWNIKTTVKEGQNSIILDQDNATK